MYLGSLYSEKWFHIQGFANLTTAHLAAITPRTMDATSWYFLGVQNGCNLMLYLTTKYVFENFWLLACREVFAQNPFYAICT